MCQYCYRPFITSVDHTSGIFKISNGERINSAGCTGACLFWGINIIEDPPRLEVDTTREDYFPLKEELDALEIIFYNVNQIGYAMLTSVPCISSISKTQVLLKDWLIIAWRRWERFTTLSHLADFQERHPRAFRCFQVMNELKMGLEEQESICITIQELQCWEQMCHVTVTEQTNSHFFDGWIPSEITVGNFKTMLTVLYEDRRKLPMRVAADKNIYRYEDFLFFYGEGPGAVEWKAAITLYKANTVILCVQNRGSLGADKDQNRLIDAWVKLPVIHNAPAFPSVNSLSQELHHC